jgi:thiamine-monophosphate kinase
MSERTEIASLGEFGLIDHLTRNIELQNASSVVGVGDDAAVIDHFGEQTVLTTDLLVEGVHFDLMYTPLKHLGYKSVVVNLSDVYAMNAIPTQIVIALALSNRFSLEAIDEFYEGVYAACEKYGVDLVGGDTIFTKRFIISVAAVGEVAPDKFVKRNTAQKGDLLCDWGSWCGLRGPVVPGKREKDLMESPGVQLILREKLRDRKDAKAEARKDVIEFFARLASSQLNDRCKRWAKLRNTAYLQAK